MSRKSYLRNKNSLKITLALIMGILFIIAVVVTFKQSFDTRSRASLILNNEVYPSYPPSYLGIYEYGGFENTQSGISCNQRCAMVLDNTYSCASIGLNSAANDGKYLAPNSIGYTTACQTQSGNCFTVMKKLNYACYGRGVMSTNCNCVQKTDVVVTLYGTSDGINSQSCNDRCSGLKSGYTCKSIGYDSNATNNNISTAKLNLSNNGFNCSFRSGSCSTKLGYVLRSDLPKISCVGKTPEWTNCNCTKSSWDNTN